MNGPVAPQFAEHVLQDDQEDTMQLTAAHLGALLVKKASDLSTSDNTATKKNNTAARIVLGFMEFILAEGCLSYMTLPSA